jgi:hypothetical protein
VRISANLCYRVLTALRRTGFFPAKHKIDNGKSNYKQSKSRSTSVYKLINLFQSHRDFHYLSGALTFTSKQSWQCKKNHHQKYDPKRNIEKKNTIRIHNATPLTTKTLNNQEPNVINSPNIITGSLAWSRPGKRNGSTIEAAAICPIATPISANTLSWE